MNNLEKLKESLKEIKHMGYIQTHRRGNTGIGKTIEDLLDIKENNDPSADFDQLGELKSCRTNQSSMVTLFTKAPKPRGVNSRLLETYGYKTENSGGKKVLRTTITGTGYSNFQNTDKGFTLEILDNKLYIRTNFSKKIEAYWEESDLEEIFNKKLPRLILELVNILMAEHMIMAQLLEFQIIN